MFHHKCGRAIKCEYSYFSTDELMPEWVYPERGFTPGSKPLFNLGQNLFELTQAYVIIACVLVLLTCPSSHRQYVMAIYLKPAVIKRRFERVVKVVD
jgi:hypothetical protein